MEFETIRSVLAWCTVINFGIIIIWWIFMVFGRDWVYRYHMKMTGLKIAEERFDAIHYMTIAMFKIFVIVFNLAPYLAMRIVG